jgi:hypothetical protein
MKSEVLMRMIHETLAMRENQPANGLWMDQDIIPNQLPHDLSQSRMVGQGVKGFQIEDFLVSLLEARIGISARRADFRHPFDRVHRRASATAPSKECANVAESLAENVTAATVLESESSLLNQFHLASEYDPRSDA